MIAVSRENLPSVQLLCGDTPIKEGRSTLLSEIFDGVELKVQLVMITIMIDTGSSGSQASNNSKIRTINISPVMC